MAQISPFLDPGPRTKPDVLALVQLSRDNILPVYLKGERESADGYAEGAVINTRFGSFPHSTLLDIPWGSQVRASIVDTGSRGRKRKRDPNDIEGDDTEGTGSGTNRKGNTVTASSGFIHILPPTPELWTTSLPHRTQVVYTPDYSYILHRIRARPGMRIIEAGAGSGSFTHAASRAVYGTNYRDTTARRGKVFSFEFNEDRYEKMKEEIANHGLKDMVELNHRDVYNGGFLVNGESPEVDCVFLDLPAPWRALPHLSRSRPDRSQIPDDVSPETADWLADPNGKPWVSPLRQDRSVHLCTFSPCIEQVTRTVEYMRRLGWMEIEMVEVAHRRLNVMRERVGLNLPNERGTNQSAGDVGEAVARLKEVEGRFKDYHARSGQPDIDMEDTDAAAAAAGQGAEDETALAKPWSVGRLIHRTEADIKTHTSYLVFAILPQEWSEDQEKAAFEKWPCGKESKVIGSMDKAARKQEKREMLMGKRRKKPQENGGEQGQ